MNRIQKISRYLNFFFNALLIIIPLCVIFQWLFIDTVPIKNLLKYEFLQPPVSTPEGYVNLGAVQWSILAKIIGFISQCVKFIPLYLSLFVLRSIFLNYKKEVIFSTMNACYYNYLGWLFFLDALIAQPLSNLLIVLATTLSNPPGHRYITVGFGTPNLEAIFCGVLVIVISWIMLEASKIQDEQSFTI
ncbi:MAG: DUF2975 domain-containing protein [Candidatus Protochlamydia sp.]|nr:DUF2975 domain-containing protein [Candidatus Protochlamydia sp.]